MHLKPTPHTVEQLTHIGYTDRRLGVITRLRSLIPNQPGTQARALIVAEQHAAIMLRRAILLDGPQLPVSESILTRTPRLRVEVVHQRMTSRHVHDRKHRQWLIQIASTLSLVERRMALAREFKGIIDSGYIHLLYASGSTSLLDQMDHAGTYFAACFFVPTHLLLHVWNQGIQTITELANIFQVTEEAIRIRIKVLGLAPGKHRHTNTIPCSHATRYRSAA